MEKLSKIDAHLLGLKRKFIMDQIREEKKLKLVEMELKKDEKKPPFWLKNPNFLSDVLGKRTSSKDKKKRYNPMEQREMQKDVKYLCLYKNNVQQQLKNRKISLDNSEDFSIEKYRFQCEYDRLLSHYNFIFGDSIHPYNL